MKYKYIIGIDEAGRGPIAGPVAVGAVLFEKNEYKKFKKDVCGKRSVLKEERSDGERSVLEEQTHTILKDSKKLSEKKREKWFEKIKENKNIRYIVRFTNAEQIDKFGIVKAINNALKRALIKLKVNPKQCLVLLDGGLMAPREFKNQKTIIKGDEKEPIISLASIVAKVSRDRYIVKLSEKYPEYGFDRHKGYGTKVHYEKLGKYGLCNIHRRSFLKNSAINNN
jgi:ribonuclease HII